MIKNNKIKNKNNSKNSKKNKKQIINEMQRFFFPSYKKHHEKESALNDYNSE